MPCICAEVDRRQATDTMSNPKTPRPVRTPASGRRAERTREALVNAAFALMAESGGDVSIDEIVAAAGISKQSFYNHFSDKQDLAKFILLQERTELEHRIGATNEGQTDAAMRLARAICVCARYFFENTQRARFFSQMFLLDIEVNNARYGSIVSDVAAGLAQGRFAVPSVEAGVSLVLGAGQAQIVRALNGQTLQMAVTSAQQLAMLMLRAFGLPPLEAEMVAARAADAIFNRDGSASPQA